MVGSCLDAAAVGSAPRPRRAFRRSVQKGHQRCDQAVDTGAGHGATAVGPADLLDYNAQQVSSRTLPVAHATLG